MFLILHDFKFSLNILLLIKIYLYLLFSTVILCGFIANWFLIIIRLFQRSKYQRYDALIGISSLFLFGLLSTYISYISSGKTSFLSLETVEEKGKGIFGIIYNFMFEEINIYTSLFIMLTALIIIALFGICSKYLFRKGFYRNIKTVTIKKKRNVHFKRRKVIWSICLKDSKIFFRQPSYILNGLIGIVIPPFLLPLSFQMIGMDGNVEKIRMFLLQKEFFWLSVILGVGIISITSSINVVASSCLSREGKYFWICKIIPVKSLYQTTGKFLFSYGIMWYGIVFNCLIFLYYFNFKLSAILIILCITSLVLYIWTIVGMIYDFGNPKLIWNNESEAVKQNLNVIFAIITNLIIIGGVVAIGRGMFEKDIEMRWCLLSLVAFLIIVGIFLTKILLVLGNRIFNNSN